MSDDDGDRNSDSDYDDTAEQRRACPSRRPLVPPNAMPDDESNNKRQRLEQTASKSRFPIKVSVRGDPVYCLDDEAIEVARAVDAKTFQPGAVDGFVFDKKTGTWFLGRCCYGDSSKWSITLQYWKQREPHAIAFFDEYGATAINSVLEGHDGETVIVPVLGHDEKQARGVLLQWCNAMAKGKPGVMVDAKILSHDVPIGKPSHERTDERGPFHVAFAPNVNIPRLAGHRRKLLVLAATHAFTNAKLAATLQVLMEGAKGLGMTFAALAAVQCRSAKANIEPVAVTQHVYNRLVAASQQALRSDTKVATAEDRWVSLIYDADEPLVGEDHYLGSTAPPRALCKSHASALIDALEDCKHDQISHTCSILLQQRGKQHQYNFLRRSKTLRLMRWFDRAVAAFEADDETFHFGSRMKARVVLVSRPNESREAFKRRTLEIEDVAIKRAYEAARKGGRPLLNEALTAFNISGLEVPVRA